MKKQEIKEYLSHCGLTEKDIEPYIEIIGTRGKWKFKDSRTFIDDEGYYHVYPLGFATRQVYIACPLCGETHFHGRADTDYEGRRAKHCISVPKGLQGEYIIEKLDQFAEKRLLKQYMERPKTRYNY